MDSDTVLYVNQWFQRVALQIAMALSAINIWTGAPLLAVWVGSRVVDSTQVTMGAVLLVVTVLFASCLGLIWALNAASAAHDRLTGRKQSVRRHVSWLRSMRAERVDWERSRATVTALDRIVVAMVVLAVIAFEIWFFVASPSPIAPGPSKD